MRRRPTASLGRGRRLMITTGGERASLGERLRGAVLKPPREGAAETRPASVGELEQRARGTDDKERLVGLFAGPCAAAITFVVVDALISNDPPARLSSGVLDSRHVSVTLYHNVLLVLLALALAMVVFAMLRKRTPLGMAAGLFGLAVFNLHYWGFGVPFVMLGAWLLVHAYRAQRDLKEARGDPFLAGAGAGARPAGRPAASKRYTPPRSSGRRA